MTSEENSIRALKIKLLSSAVVPLIAGVGMAVAGTGASVAAVSGVGAANPTAVPWLIQSANPTAVPRPSNPTIQLAACNPCNPCAAGGCNPCAAGGCNPCAAGGCNPCAAGACNPCNPCAGGGMMSECVIPRLAAAHPCATAKGCNPCNPCNPCAAGGCNPCNPCAAGGCNPCNPCNPCGGAAMAEISGDEAAAAYDCLIDQLLAGYAKSDNPTAAAFSGWRRYNSIPYQSATHGGRHVNNYANAMASAYWGASGFSETSGCG